MPAPVSQLDLALMRGAIEEVPVGVAILRDGALQHANSALERMLGATSGQLDGHSLEQLFDAPTLVTVKAFLDQRRVFDGRVTASGVDGRTLTAEAHVERYQSDAGTGGFMLMRDVSLEASALNRLVSLFGGVLFCIRVTPVSFENISGNAAAILGIEPSTIVADPSCLGALVSETDRRRVAKVYQSLVRGKERTATIELSIRRNPNETIPLRILATGRVSVRGDIDHVDGVAIVSERRTQASGSLPPPTDELTGVGSLAALLDASSELMRESAHLSTSAATHLRNLKASIKQLDLPKAELEPLLADVEAATAMVSSATAVNRRVRRAMATRVTAAKLRDVIENVRSALVPIVGDHALVVRFDDAANVQLEGRVDEVALGLMQLVLRSLRRAAGGVNVCVAPCAEKETDIIVDLHGVLGRASSPNVGSAPDTDRALLAAARLLSTAGCEIDKDLRTERIVQTCVRIKHVRS